MDLKRGGLGPIGLSSHRNRGIPSQYNVTQYITLEILFVSFLFFNPNDNVDVGVVGWVFILADFGKATCSLLLAILATFSGNSGGRKLTPS